MIKIRESRRRSFLDPITALPALVLALGACAAQAPVSEDVTAFVGVNVIPMDSERVLENQTVLVEGDRIVTVGPTGEVEVPAGAQEIDGQDKYLLPGLAEMHGHVPPPEEPEELTEAVLFLYLAGGVTTVRGMLGAEGQLELRERVQRGELAGPTLYLAGPSFSDGTIDSPEEARERVREQAAEGWDLLKVHPGLTVEEYDAMAETAHEEGMRFAGHVPSDVGFLHAVRSGQETFDHLDGMIAYAADEAALNPERLAEVVREMREAGAWAVPTMALWEVILGAPEIETLSAYPELRYMPAEEVEGWTSSYEQRVASSDLAAARREAEQRTQLLGELHRGGVRILMGTDAPQLFSVPGFSIYRELERMLAAGMSPFDILETGTKNVGEYFSEHDQFGLIEPGHRADLLLLDGDPLTDLLPALRNRSGVMVRGEWIAESEIQSRLEQIAASSAQ